MGAPINTVDAPIRSIPARIPDQLLDDLPDATPPKAVEAATERFGLSEGMLERLSKTS